MSVWTDAVHLAGFVDGKLHRQVLRRRREWFQHMSEAYIACWWVPTGHRPTTAPRGARAPSFGVAASISSFHIRSFVRKR